MPTDLLPLNAFAPDAGAGTQTGPEPFTLTLRPAQPADSDSLAGRIAKLAGAATMPANTVRASVVPANGQALTLTF